jgi:hypothetical protein
MAANDEAVHAARTAVDRDRDFVVELTRDLVRIPTINPKFFADPEVNREAELQTRLDGVLTAEDFKTSRWDVFPDRPNLIGDWPTSTWCLWSGIAGTSIPLEPRSGTAVSTVAARLT